MECRQRLWMSMSGSSSGDNAAYVVDGTPIADADTRAGTLVVSLVVA